jgi:hypothetical protein
MGVLSPPHSHTPILPLVRIRGVTTTSSPYWLRFLNIVIKNFGHMFGAFGAGEYYERTRKCPRYIAVCQARPRALDFEPGWKRLRN